LLFGSVLFVVLYCFCYVELCCFLFLVCCFVFAVYVLLFVVCCLLFVFILSFCLFYSFVSVLILLFWFALCLFLFVVLVFVCITERGSPKGIPRSGYPKYAKILLPTCKNKHPIKQRKV